MPRCGPGDNYLDRLSSASYKLQAIVSKMAQVIKMEGSQKVVCYERPFFWLVLVFHRQVVTR